MIQELVIGIGFIASLIYVWRLIARNLKARESCATGCGKCSAPDASSQERMEKSLRSTP